MKSKLIILILSVLVCLLDIYQSYSAYGREINFDIDIEKYKKEAKGLIVSSNDPKLADTAKGLKGFTDNPEEASLTEDELRIKGDEKVKGKDKSTKEDKGIREAINSVKNDNATNPHRSKYTVTKLKNKDFIKKSGAIIENPISGLNVAANAECRVIGSEKGGENVSFEEYWVDVEDSRIKEVQQTCEEDEEQLFFCNRSIKDVNCSSKTPCAFDNAEGEGGLYTSASNSEFASSSGGKFKWNYDYSKGELVFGNDTKYSYNCRDEGGGDGCCTKEFSARFFIKDKGSVSEFAMSEVFENNIMDIWVNGYLIYQGKHYGERPRGECDGGTYPRECWLNACHEHWKSHYVDLKSYIRDGWNEVSVKLSYTRVGHAGLKIRAKQYCCTNWSDEWETDCPVN
jgi:hypothetical protein